jgi:hypothetical protein
MVKSNLSIQDGGVLYSQESFQAELSPKMRKANRKDKNIDQNVVGIKSSADLRKFKQGGFVRRSLSME